MKNFLNNNFHSLIYKKPRRWGFLFDPHFFFEVDFFLGTFAPLFRASERPIAIACLRLVTFFPLLPLFNVPFFFSCIALFTFFWAPFEYFAIIKFYVCT